MPLAHRPKVEKLGEPWATLSSGMPYNPAVRLNSACLLICNFRAKLLSCIFNNLRNEKLAMRNSLHTDGQILFSFRSKEPQAAPAYCIPSLDALRLARSADRFEPARGAVRSKHSGLKTKWGHGSAKTNNCLPLPHDPGSGASRIIGDASMGGSCDAERPSAWPGRGCTRAVAPQNPCL